MNRSMRGISPWLRIILAAGLTAALVLCGGCKVSKEDGKKVRDLEFSVVDRKSVV